MRPALLFGRRERDIPITRESLPVASPRGLCRGDVVRDVLFPLTIERVASFDGDSARVVFESGDTCLIRHLFGTYEHADGAPIDGVGR